MVQWASDEGEPELPRHAANKTKSRREVGWTLYLLDSRPGHSSTVAHDKSRRQGPFSQSYVKNVEAYHPPELLANGSYYGEEADCWALGIVLYRICEPGCEPYAPIQNSDMPGSPAAGRRRRDLAYSQPERESPKSPSRSTAASRVLRQVEDGVWDGRNQHPLLFRQGQDPDLKSLICSLLDPRPEHRSTARQALQHTFFAERQMSTDVPRSPRASPRKLTLSVDSLSQLNQQPQTPEWQSIDKSRSGTSGSGRGRGRHHSYDNSLNPDRSGTTASNEPGPPPPFGSGQPPLA